MYQAAVERRREAREQLKSFFENDFALTQPTPLPPEVTPPAAPISQLTIEIPTPPSHKRIPHIKSLPTSQASSPRSPRISTTPRHPSTTGQRIRHKQQLELSERIRTVINKFPSIEPSFHTAR